MMVGLGSPDPMDGPRFENPMRLLSATRVYFARLTKALYHLPILLVPLPTLSYTEHRQATMNNRACDAYGS